MAKKTDLSPEERERQEILERSRQRIRRQIEERLIADQMRAEEEAEAEKKSGSS